MQLKNSLNQISPFAKIMVLISTSVGSTFIIFLILFALNQAFWGIPLDFSQHLNETSQSEFILAAKIMQMISQLSMFILPALVYLFLVKPSISADLGYKSGFNLKSFATVVVVTLLAIPFINLLAQWNMNWHLPESMAEIENWMRNTQLANDNLINLLAKMETNSDIIINVLMMAILPAVGEELIFRGALQPQIIKMVRNPHVGIIITAILFSAIHLQFLGFFSRAILGALFGYFYYYSKNITWPIIAHFLNNFLALVMVFVYGTELDETSFEDPYEITLVAPTLIAFSLSIGLLIYNRSGLKSTKSEIVLE